MHENVSNISMNRMNACLALFHIRPPLFSCSICPICLPFVAEINVYKKEKGENSKSNIESRKRSTLDHRERKPELAIPVQ